MKIAYSKLFSLFLIFSFALGIFNVPGVMAYPDTISTAGWTSHTTGSLVGREAMCSIGEYNFLVSVGIDGGSIVVDKYTSAGIYVDTYTQAIDVDDHVVAAVNQYDASSIIIFVAGEAVGSNVYIKVQAWTFDGTVFLGYGTDQSWNVNPEGLYWVAISEVSGDKLNNGFVVAVTYGDGNGAPGVYYDVVDPAQNSHTACAVSHSANGWLGLMQTFVYSDTDNKVHLFAPGYVGYYTPSTKLITEIKENSLITSTSIYFTIPFDEDVPYGVCIWSWGGYGSTGLTDHVRFMQVYSKSGVNYIDSCYYQGTGDRTTGSLTQSSTTVNGKGVVEWGTLSFQNIITFVTFSGSAYIQYSFDCSETSSVIEDVLYYTMGDVESAITTAYAIRWAGQLLGNMDYPDAFCEGWYSRGDMNSVDGSSHYEIICVERLYSMTIGQDFGDIDTALNITAVANNDSTAFWFWKQAVPTTSDYALAEVSFAINSTDADLNIGVYVTASAAIPSGTNPAYKIGEWFLEQADAAGLHVYSVSSSAVLGKYVVLYICPDVTDANITWATAVTGTASTGATTMYYEEPITSLPLTVTGTGDGSVDCNMTTYPEGYYYYLTYIDVDTTDDDAGISGDTFVFTYDTTVYDITGGTSTTITTGFYAMADEIGIDRSAFGILLTLICFFALWFISSTWSKEMPQNIFFVVLLFAGSASMWAFVGVLPITVWVGFMAIVALLLFSKLREV